MPIDQNHGAVSFDDFPGDSSALLNELFPQAENVAATTQLNGTQEPQVAQPQAPTAQPEQFRFETRTGSVYDSMDALKAGVEHKDTYIQELRAKLASFEQPAQAQPAQPISQEQIDSYIRNPERYLQDLVKGAEGDPNLYVNAQLGLVDERLNQVLSPVASFFQELVSERTEKALNSQLPDFSEVSKSPEYNQVLSDLPDLKQAIDGARSNFAMQDRLPGLLKVAYLAAKGLQYPKIAEAARAQAPAPTPPQPRQTLSSSPLSPPSNFGPAPNWATSEGRKEIMARLEASGVLDKKF